MNELVIKQTNQTNVHLNFVENSQFGHNSPGLGLKSVAYPHLLTL